MDHIIKITCIVLEIIFGLFSEDTDVVLYTSDGYRLPEAKEGTRADTQ